MTGRDLITASLRLIGAIAPGESIPAAEATDGLAALNRMIDSWSNESLLIYAKVREEFTLTASDGIYSMGTGGDFSTTRPVHIEEAAIEIVSASPTYEVPITIIRNATEWAAVISKDTTSELPQYLYAEGTYPTDTLNLYPVPTVANKLVLYSQKPLTTITALATSVSMPPGYERALIYNFAVEISPEYNRMVPDVVMQTAIDSKALIKRTNHKPSYLKCDPALLGKSSFNIYSGGS